MDIPYFFHNANCTPVPTQFPGRLLIMSALTGFSARKHLGHDIPIVQILSADSPVYPQPLISPMLM
jgi:hypothetical protein